MPSHVPFKPDVVGGCVRIWDSKLMLRCFAGEFSPDFLSVHVTGFILIYCSSKWFLKSIFPPTHGVCFNRNMWDTDVFHHGQMMARCIHAALVPKGRRKGFIGLQLGCLHVVVCVLHICFIMEIWLSLNICVYSQHKAYIYLFEWCLLSCVWLSESRLIPAVCVSRHGFRGPP